MTLSHPERRGPWEAPLSHLNYLPLPFPFFAILAGIFLALIVLIEIGVLRYVYTRLGVGPRAVMLLLFASLLGSYFNIPVAQLPGHRMLAERDVYFFGMEYAVPVAVTWPGTIIAVNIGGAVVPTIMSLYLLIRHELWFLGIIATAIMAVVCHELAHPVPGLGIALPVFVPALTAAILALLLSRRNAAALAYVAGSMGTLIGADLTNLGAVQGLGAPVASIGGAGTFDGIFLSGVIAVIIASIGAAA